MLEYLSKYAQKAYREISAIAQNPGFLFSNDPELVNRESIYNYCYIHGFNRLIKNNRITKERLLEAFIFLENSIDNYLKKHSDEEGIEENIEDDYPSFTKTYVKMIET